MRLKRSVIGIVAVFVFLALFFVVQKPKGASDNDLFLSPPPFVLEAQAASSYIGNYLDQEAGISAWYLGSSMNLTNIKNTVCIADETPVGITTYLICTVAVPNYPNRYDVHVYAHQDGWILAYYPNEDPTSKIIDVVARSLNTTKLKTVVSLVASAGGSGFTDVSYYDFRYPDAAHILLVAGTETDGNNFTIEMPTSYVYFERSWAYWRSSSASNDYFRKDGVNFLPNNTYSSGSTLYGTFTASELTQGVTYTFSLYSYWSDAYGALAITYKVP